VGASAEDEAHGPGRFVLGSQAQGLAMTTPRFDEDLSIEQWRKQEAAADAEEERRDFDRDRFREDVPLSEDEQ